MNSFLSASLRLAATGVISVWSLAYAVAGTETPIQAQDHIQDHKQIQQHTQEQSERNKEAKEQQQKRIENQYEHQYKKYPDNNKGQQGQFKQQGKGSGKQGGGKH